MKQHPEQGSGKNPSAPATIATDTRSSSATSSFVPQTFQQSQQPAPAARENILTIPETQMPASQIIQTAQQSQVATKGQQETQRADDFICSYLQLKTCALKTAYFHTNPDEALQTTISCLCHRQRKSTQYIRTL